jgi:eukaryotic-like serine/threonine-protein kinase
VAMKHVREELPDVLLRRPEASSTLASVVDRATAKELDRRYQSDRDLITDLEEVLAIETARSGQATGEVTAVIRTLPPSARRRIPLRMRHPVRLLVALAIIGAAVAVALILLADRTERGAQGTRNVPSGAPKSANLIAISLRQSAAKDYDPLGDNASEHPTQAKLVVDGETSTSWSTETYEGNTLGSKAGVGIYVIADPTVAARQIQIVTPTKGWSGAVYAAPAGQPPKSIEAGWKKLIGIDSAKESTRLSLDTGHNPYRYYLVWITKLPPGADKVQISEIRLWR